ncbi:MAG: hypothetical protein IKJ06_06305, partial [Clostridia bacterium]|nr:hypothetical protein [Clostridia bacterium]
IGNQILRAKTDAKPTNNPADDAVSNFRVNSTGTYKIWVNSIDYELDQQGSRFYNVDINGNRLAKTFGQHGVTGFTWEDGGTFELQRGVLNELRLVDTAAFFGRLNGLIITNDLDFVPSSDLANYKDYTVNNASATEFVPASFPEWANGDINETQVETIENDTFKINFYKGSASRGGVVQNEIFMKRNNEWVVVKERTEDLGVLAMRANRSRIMDEKPIRFDATSTAFDYYDQSFDTLVGEYSNPLIREYYKSATPEWLIPNSLEKVDDKTVRMGLSSEHVNGTLTFTFDDLSDDPKVTFSANVKEDGAYSFSYFSGNDFSDESFERVTAPFNFIQDEIPADSSVLAESAMFTPMVTFTFDNNGKKFTKGVAVDPTSIREYVARLADRDFGLTFRSPDGNARGQLIAPTFGTYQCQFKSGDYYTFSYRIIYRDATGYETLKHIATNLYNCVDLRENHYASMNETIYNMTDLIMDDVYSGWDERQLGFMDTEGDGTAAHSNFMAMVSQYLLTENEELLEKRVIPTVAFSLTRGRINYQRHVENPYPLGVIAPFSGGSFVGMYQA